MIDERLAIARPRRSRFIALIVVFVLRSVALSAGTRAARCTSIILIRDGTRYTLKRGDYNAHVGKWGSVGEEA